WLLPKGRKDRGEDVTVAAVRETFKGTGYRDPCERLSLDLITRNRTRRRRTRRCPFLGARGRSC
ncbi:hypothetical protein EDB86DRAFT_2812453, partial [Lactarius hatsudake]